MDPGVPRDLIGDPGDHKTRRGQVNKGGYPRNPRDSRDSGDTGDLIGDLRDPESKRVGDSYDRVGV